MSDTERTCGFKPFGRKPCGAPAQFSASRGGDPGVTGNPRSVNDACGKHLAWAVTDLEDGDGYVVAVTSLSPRSKAARAPGGAIEQAERERLERVNQRRADVLEQQQERLARGSSR